MPYIDKRNREEIDKTLDPLIETLLSRGISVGETVYVVYKIVKTLFDIDGFSVKSDALKVLESAKLEYYRRVIAPYEDKKIAENGDI